MTASLKGVKGGLFESKVSPKSNSIHSGQPSGTWARIS